MTKQKQNQLNFEFHFIVSFVFLTSSENFSKILTGQTLLLVKNLILNIFFSIKY